MAAASGMPLGHEQIPEGTFAMRSSRHDLPVSAESYWRDVNYLCATGRRANHGPQ